MWARIIDQAGVKTVAEVVTTDPTTMFTDEVAAMFEPATEDMVYRAELHDVVWIAPPPDDPAPDIVAQPSEPPKQTVMAPIEFFFLFTPQEEYAIREAAKGATPEAGVLGIFLRRLDHPSLKEVDIKSAQVQQGLGLLVAMGLITAERSATISEGM